MIICSRNSKFEWKRITDVEGVTGSTTVSYANINDISQLHVVVQWNGLNGNIQRQVFDVYPQDLSDSDCYIVHGGYDSEQYYQYCELVISRTKMRINALRYNGQNILASAKVWVSYR